MTSALPGQAHEGLQQSQYLYSNYQNAENEFPGKSNNYLVDDPVPEAAWAIPARIAVTSEEQVDRYIFSAYVQFSTQALPLAVAAVKGFTNMFIENEDHEPHDRGSMQPESGYRRCLHHLEIESGNNGGLASGTVQRE